MPLALGALKVAPPSLPVTWWPANTQESIATSQAQARTGRVALGTESRGPGGTDEPPRPTAVFLVTPPPAAQGSPITLPELALLHPNTPILNPRTQGAALHAAHGLGEREPRRQGPLALKSPSSWTTGSLSGSAALA